MRTLDSTLSGRKSCEKEEPRRRHEDAKVEETLHKLTRNAFFKIGFGKCRKILEYRQYIGIGLCDGKGFRRLVRNELEVFLVQIFQYFFNITDIDVDLDRKERFLALGDMFVGKRNRSAGKEKVAGPGKLSLHRRREVSDLRRRSEKQLLL